MVHAPPSGSPARRVAHGSARTRRPRSRCTLSPLRPHARPDGGHARYGPNRPWRARPGDLDRRQGIDDPEARGLRPRGGQAGRPVHPLPGAVLRALLLPGPGRPVLQLHRAHPGRPDHQADAGPRQADRHGHRRPDVRGGRQGQRDLLQHRGRHRRRRHVPRQVPQDAHPARQGLLGEVLLPARATSATRSSRRPSARSASTSATTGTSPRAPGRWASTAPRSC